MCLQVLQYSVLPLIGFMISRHWGLSSSLAIGVALVRGCWWSAGLVTNTA
jgi:predicted Na+-dependent transporter